MKEKSGKNSSARKLNALKVQISQIRFPAFWSFTNPCQKPYFIFEDPKNKPCLKVI